MPRAFRLPALVRSSTMQHGSVVAVAWWVSLPPCRSAAVLLVWPTPPSHHSQHCVSFCLGPWDEVGKYISSLRGTVQYQTKRPRAG